MRTSEMIENLMVRDELWEKEYRVFAHCYVCGEEILADGTYYYDFDGDVVCCCCANDYIDEHFRKKTEIS